MHGFQTWGCQEYVRGFEGIVGQGRNTLGKSEYTRAGYTRAVIIKSEYAKVKAVISRMELQII